MRTSNAAKPATAETVNGLRDDRLGGAIEETNSSPSDGAQAKPAGSTEAGFSDFEPVENQGLSEPEIDLAPKARHLRFERVNEVTWKITDGRLTITPTPPGRHWSGHKTTRVEMIKGIRPVIVLHDPIAHLNQITAAVFGANEKWRAPIEPDLLAYIREVETGVPPSRRPHGALSSRALQGDNYPLEYYDDGYPKLPSCLRRGKSEESA